MPLDCNLFAGNNRTGGYTPLSCRPQITETVTLTGHGLENRQQLFFYTKANTIRERATLDLLYPAPFWLVRARQRLSFGNRITSTGQNRITSHGRQRIAELARSPKILTLLDRITAAGKNRITSEREQRVSEV